jgi:site-specific DNA recombinase
LGVHIVEASSGKSTLTPRGKNEIFSQLLAANNENLERQEIIIPFMKSFLEKGGRFGLAPLGYDHYGPRVKNPKFLKANQEFVINKHGKLLQKAFKWKISGHYSDAQIIFKLAEAGLKIRPQKLSKIWRNPFYCGWSVNKLLDEPVKGNWEPLITEDEYKKLMSLLEGNIGGYQHSIYEADKVLGSGFLKCSGCGGNLTAYRNKKKNLMYYKCTPCCDNANAFTSKKSRTKGLNDRFEELLDGLSVTVEFQNKVLGYLTSIFERKNKNSGETVKTLKGRLDDFTGLKKEVQLKLGYGKITQEIYDITVEDIQKNIDKIQKELNAIPPATSNLESLIKFALKSLRNLRQIWVSASYDGKRKIQKALFPHGLIVDIKNRLYLTSPINKFVSKISSLSATYAVNKEGNLQHFVENSLSVARRRLELPTSGL